MPNFELSNPDGVRRAATSYSLCASIDPGARRIVISGQVGMRPDGSTPDDGAAQLDIAYANLRTILRAHGLDLTHIVKQTIFLTDRGLIPAYREARARNLGDHAPTSTLLIVSGLADPAFLVEIEAEAVG